MKEFNRKVRNGCRVIFDVEDAAVGEGCNGGRFDFMQCGKRIERCAVFCFDGDGHALLAF